MPPFSAAGDVAPSMDIERAVHVRLQTRSCRRRSTVATAAATGVLAAAGIDIRGPRRRRVAGNPGACAAPSPARAGGATAWCPAPFARASCRWPFAYRSESGGALATICRSCHVAAGQAGHTRRQLRRSSGCATDRHLLLGTNAHTPPADARRLVARSCSGTIPPTGAGPGDGRDWLGRTATTPDGHQHHLIANPARACQDGHVAMRSLPFSPRPFARQATPPAPARRRLRRRTRPEPAQPFANGPSADRRCAVARFRDDPTTRFRPSTTRGSSSATAHRRSSRLRSRSPLPAPAHRRASSPSAARAVSANAARRAGDLRVPVDRAGHLGLESHFGEFTGATPVFQALATLAWEPRRSEFSAAAVQRADDGFGRVYRTRRR